MSARKNAGATLWLDHRAKARKTAIFHALPDVLDLLTVCVEAGLGLNATPLSASNRGLPDVVPMVCERLQTLYRLGRLEVLRDGAKEVTF